MKKYWIRLKGQEEYPMVCEISEKSLEKDFIFAKRHFRDGTIKQIGFSKEELISMEEYEVTEAEDDE